MDMSILLIDLRRPLCAGLVVLLTLFSMAGCSAKDELVPAPAQLMNYTDEDVYLTVSSPDRPSETTYLEMGKRAGGGIVCCVGLPSKWRPGLIVQVDYRYGNERRNENKHRKTIELPPYPDGIAGPVYISILPEDEVEVISTMYGLGHPRWSGKMKQLP
jgi:hypothetical protein